VDLLPIGPLDPQSLREASTSISTNTKQEYLKARNNYFQVIKASKRDYWNSFLEKEDPKTIFRALKYTKSTRVERIPSILEESSFKGKARVFRETLFPKPPASLEPDWARFSTSSE
jgi:hypothetical protein